MYARLATALAVCTLVAFAGVSSAAAEEPVDAICNHLQAHAEDFSEEDADRCAEEMAGVLEEFTDEAAAEMVTCVTSQTPVSKDAFGECLLAGMGGEEPVGGDPEPAASPEVLAATKAICAHLDEHADEWSEQESAECAEMMPFLFQMVGDENVEAVQKCVLSHTPITQDKFAACMPKDVQ